MAYEWYSVVRGMDVGVFDDWLMVAPLVQVKGAIWKGYHDEAEAHRRYNAAKDAGYVRIIGAGLSQTISRSASAATVPNHESVPMPARSQTLPNFGSGSYLGQGTQTMTPPHSPRHNRTRDTARPGSTNSPQRRNDRAHESSRGRRSNASVQSQSPRHLSQINMPMGSNGLLLPPPLISSDHNYTSTDVASTHPREYEGRHASRASARRERQLDLTTSTLLQPVSVPRVPRGSTYEPESISAPILRGRSDSSASSVSAVTCPESPPFSSDSDSSLVEPLDLDDPAPIYPLPPAKRTGYAPLTSAPGRAARSPSPSLVRNFSNVTLRPDRRGSSSSPVASTSKSVPRQPLLSPLNMQTGFTSTTLRSPSVISTNSLRNMFKIDKANLPIYSVHASDSEESEEEPVQPSPRSAKSPAESPAESASRIRLRKHLEKVNWPESPSHVKPDVHDAKFDPRSPIHQEARVPQDTTGSMFSRPSPRACTPKQVSSPILVQS